MGEQMADFYEFGRFRLKADERVLLREQELVPLTPKAFDVLLALLENDGRTVPKDDLMKKVEGVLTSMGEKDVKVTDIKELSDDYSVANISSVDEKGKTTKGKVLVGTDVTDNYIVMVGTDADKFSANEKTIDEIWGSFGMYSGGASGNN